MPGERSELLWKATALVAGTTAAVGATRLVGLAWKKVTGAEVPLNLVAGETTRRREIVWVVASGISVAFVRLVARRGVARVWRARTGRYPRALVEPAPGAVPEPA
jgi:hypothetical protein